MSFTLASQLLLWTSRGISPSADYLKFNAVSEWLLDHYPVCYSPDPEIFAERLLGREEVLNNDALFVRKGSGSLYKLLMRSDSFVGGKIWTDDLSLFPLGKTSVWEKPGSWIYVSGGFEKEELPERLSFKYDENSLFSKGWSYRENGFRWSIGNQSVLQLCIPEGHYSGLMRIKFIPQGEGKDISIKFIGQILKRAFFEGPQDLVLNYDVKAIHTNCDNFVEFYTENPAKSELPLDPRIFGFRFINLSFQYNELSR